MRSLIKVTWWNLYYAILNTILTYFPLPPILSLFILQPPSYLRTSSKCRYHFLMKWTNIRATSASFLMMKMMIIMMMCWMLTKISRKIDYVLNRNAEGAIKKSTWCEELPIVRQFPSFSHSRYVQLNLWTHSFSSPQLNI